MVNAQSSLVDGHGVEADDIPFPRMSLLLARYLHISSLPDCYRQLLTPTELFPTSSTIVRCHFAVCTNSVPTTRRYFIDAVSQAIHRAKTFATILRCEPLGPTSSGRHRLSGQYQCLHVDLCHRHTYRESFAQLEEPKPSEKPNPHTTTPSLPPSLQQSPPPTPLITSIPPTPAANASTSKRQLRDRWSDLGLGLGPGRDQVG